MSPDIELKALGRIIEALETIAEQSFKIEYKLEILAGEVETLANKIPYVAAAINRIAEKE